MFPRLSSPRKTFFTVVKWFDGKVSREWLMCSTVKVVSRSIERDVDVNKSRIARLEKGIHVFLCTSQTSLKVFPSFKETNDRARHRKRWPNCWPKYRIQTYIYYIYIYIYIYPHRKRRRADGELVSVGLA